MLVDLNVMGVQGCGCTLKAKPQLPASFKTVAVIQSIADESLCSVKYKTINILMIHKLCFHCSLCTNMEQILNHQRGYDPKRHDLIEGVSKCMISGQEVQAKFNEFREAQGSHDEVYTDGSKMNERVGAAAVINRHFQNGETTCPQLSKRLPDNSTIFAAETTVISLALNYYQHMGPVHHDVVVYSDSMSCLQAIEGEDTKKPMICHIMNLLWSLNDKGTRVRFCWVPSHCGIDGNETVDQLAKETFDQDIDPLASVHYTDMKPLVNSYIQKLVQTKWDVAVNGRDLYLVKPTLGPPKKFWHLTRAEKVVITRLRIGHTKATKSHILSRGPPTGCVTIVVKH